MARRAAARSGTVEARALAARQSALRVAEAAASKWRVCVKMRDDARVRGARAARGALVSCCVFSHAA